MSLWEFLNGNVVAPSWSAIFKVSDTAFRFVSWIIILTVLRGFLTCQPSSWWFFTIHLLLDLMFSATILASTFHLFTARVPGYPTLNLFTVGVKVLITVFGCFASAFIISPKFELDGFIDLLAKQKPIINAEPHAMAQ